MYFGTSFSYLARGRGMLVRSCGLAITISGAYPGPIATYSHPLSKKYLPITSILASNNFQVNKTIHYMELTLQPTHSFDKQPYRLPCTPILPNSMGSKITLIGRIQALFHLPARPQIEQLQQPFHSYCRIHKSQAKSS